MINLYVVIYHSHLKNASGITSSKLILHSFSDEKAVKYSKKSLCAVMTEKQLEEIKEFAQTFYDKTDQFHDMRHAELTVK